MLFPTGRWTYGTDGNFEISDNGVFKEYVCGTIHEGQLHQSDLPWNWSVDLGFGKSMTFFLREDLWLHWGTPC